MGKKAMLKEDTRCQKVISRARDYYSPKRLEGNQCNNQNYRQEDCRHCNFPNTNVNGRRSHILKEVMHTILVKFP